MKPGLFITALIISSILMISTISYGQGLRENTEKYSAKGTSGVGLDFGYTGKITEDLFLNKFYPAIRGSYNILNGLSIGTRLRFRYSSLKVAHSPDEKITSKEIGLMAFIRYQPFRKIGGFLEPEYGIIPLIYSNGNSSYYLRFAGNLGISGGYSFAFNALPELSIEAKIRVSTYTHTYNGIQFSVMPAIGIRHNFLKASNRNNQPGTYKNTKP